MQLPKQLLVLHGESLVDFGFLLQGLLQHCLLSGELPKDRRASDHENWGLSDSTAAKVFALYDPDRSMASHMVPCGPWSTDRGNS